MKIIKDNNGVPEDYSITQLKADNPNTSFRRGHPDAQINQFGVYRVQPTVQPAYDNMVERLEAGTPIKSGDEWIEVWNKVPLSQAEIDASSNDKANAEIDKLTKEALPDILIHIAAQPTASQKLKDAGALVAAEKVKIK